MILIAKMEPNDLFPSAASILFVISSSIEIECLQGDGFSTRHLDFYSVLFFFSAELFFFSPWWEIILMED